MTPLPNISTRCIGSNAYPCHAITATITGSHTTSDAAEAAVTRPAPPPLFFSRKFQLAWMKAEKRTRPSASAVTRSGLEEPQDVEVLRVFRHHGAEAQQPVDRHRARVEREVAGEDVADHLLDGIEADLAHFPVLVGGLEVERQPQVVHEEDLAMQALGNRILDAHGTQAVHALEERRRDARLLPRLLAQ